MTAPLPAPHDCDTRHPCPHQPARSPAQPTNPPEAGRGRNEAAEPPQTTTAGATTVSDAAVEAFLRARQAGYGASLDYAIANARQGTLWEAARGWLAAAAPHIAAQALHDAADQIQRYRIRHSPTDREPGLNAAWVLIHNQAIRALAGGLGSGKPTRTDCGRS